MTTTPDAPVAPVVQDLAGREFTKGQEPKGVLALLGDELVVLKRFDFKSQRAVVETLERDKNDTLARTAKSVKLLKLHGRFVSASSKTAQKVRDQRAAQ